MKRILSFVIALILLSTASYNAFALSDYEAEVLSALSIMQGDPNGNMRYLDMVSRAECAKIVVASSVYRDMVEEDVKSSPFKDVTYEHWAAPYITAGIRYGLFKGYLDATFRPAETVLLEEAIVMFLRVLGYTDDDMGNQWPYSQIETAKKAGLLNNVNKTAGQKLNRYDIATIAYNTLASKQKNSDVTYLSTFNRTIGPITVSSSNWYQELGADSSVRVVKDGEKASLSDVKMNDIVYYMEEYSTALVYSKKITGIYEEALPDKNHQTSVKVSGITYSLEGTNALSKLSSGGTFIFGDTVTLLLGKNGGVADVLTGSAVLQIGDTIYGLLTSSGTKETTVSGTKVTKQYVSITLASGEVLEYITNKNYDSMLNQVVTVKLQDGIATLTKIVSSHGISGEFSWETGTKRLGSYTLSDDIDILETTTVNSDETAAVASVYPQRLNGITIGKNEVLYVSKDPAGNIDGLILCNVTGDAYTYGIVTKANQTISNLSISGSYEYISNGVSGALSSQNKAFQVSSGLAVQIITNGREITTLAPLSRVSGNKISNVNGSRITIGGKEYIMWDKVQIYYANKTASSVSYNMITMDEFIEIAENYAAYVYTDKPSSTGGRIRIIILS